MQKFGSRLGLRLNRIQLQRAVVGRNATSVSKFQSQQHTLEQIKFDFSSEINVVNFSGTRSIELARFKKGNPLDTRTLRAIRERMLILGNNPAIGAVFLGSCTDRTDVFSVGLCQKTLHSSNLDRRKQIRANLFSELSEVALSISEYKKKLLAVFSGLMPGTAMGLLLNSEVRRQFEDDQCTPFFFSFFSFYIIYITYCLYLFIYSEFMLPY